MLYLLAIILPTVAVLLIGRPLTALLNVFLTCLFWVPGIIHAFMVVNEYKADKRANRMARTINRPRPGP